MTGHLPYTEEDVELVARVLGRFDLVSDDDDEITRTVCEETAASQWHAWADRARAILAALSSANRLVPPGSEVREEFAVRIGGVFTFGRFDEHAKAERYRAARHPSGQVVRRVASPWSPSVPDTEEGTNGG